ncbi:sel1 repeat family protein [Helicobacter muridarum]|uniref:Beta-lactamase n=1 Tax=Helicobacter muridarum TaxID=216 RepID=A0A377PT62_9HELI|nr:sel1 repeat family protein [Helicobacter muridarum]TLE00332.1 sel1 repeat family protein [Helicobacter muridarum]STQ85835.1 cysteine-rich protein H [Helicobacter muridarum]
MITKIFVIFYISLMLMACANKTIEQQISIKDADRIKKYNELDNLKEGIWYVDKWKDYAKKICDDSGGFDCSVLGEIYHDRFYGYDSKENRQEAITLLEKSCEMQDSRSCLKLAIFSSYSDIPIANSKDLFKKAYDIASDKCSNQYIFDCMTLAMIYFEGYATFERNRKTSKNLASYSCDNGYAWACAFLANNANNNQELRDSHKKACELGIKAFCFFN